MNAGLNLGQELVAGLSRVPARWPGSRWAALSAAALTALAVAVLPQAPGTRPGERAGRERDLERLPRGLDPR